MITKNIAIVEVIGTSPLLFGKFAGVEKSDLSYHDQEVATWRERLHYDINGDVFIPAIAWKNTIMAIAQRLSMKIPGNKNQTFTKNFKSAVTCYKPSMLGVKKDDVRGEWMFVPSDGKHNGSKRVHKCFPIIDQWQTTIEFAVFDGLINENIFLHHISQAGLYTGVLSMRPANGGDFGRFSVSKFTWTALDS